MLHVRNVLEFNKKKTLSLVTDDCDVSSHHHFEIKHSQLKHVKNTRERSLSVIQRSTQSTNMEIFNEHIHNTTNTFYVLKWGYDSTTILKEIETIRSILLSVGDVESAKVGLAIPFATFASPSLSFIITPLFEYDLFDFNVDVMQLASSTATDGNLHPYSSHLCNNIALQLSNGLEVLHNAGFTHSDIKMENVFVYGNPLDVIENATRSTIRCVLADFGHAFRICSNKSEAPTGANMYAIHGGTLSNFSPVRWLDISCRPSRRDDYWALMAIMFRLITQLEFFPYITQERQLSPSKTYIQEFIRCIIPPISTETVTHHHKCEQMFIDTSPLCSWVNDQINYILITFQSVLTSNAWLQTDKDAWNDVALLLLSSSHIPDAVYATRIEKFRELMINKQTH